MLLSVDVAHGIHPNHTDKHDPTNQNVLGKGVCIKEACSQSYACLLYTSMRKYK